MPRRSTIPAASPSCRWGSAIPGTGSSGDLPPRRESAPAWRAPPLKLLPAIELTLVIGQYALDWHPRTTRKASLTQTVQDWQQHWPSVLPLPHPSLRNNIWLKKNPWFAAQIVPMPRGRIAALLKG